MSINPENISTIRVDQLVNLGVTLESLFPHTVGTELTSSPISDLVTLVANAIESTEALGFLPISVTDGQQLPDVPTTPGFFLAGAGTYLNVNGFPNLVCTENLNVIMTVDDHWEIAVQIAVNPLTGSVQSVTGSAVDNTDPLNPVINLSGATPDLQAVTDEGNTTTNPITVQDTAIFNTEIVNDGNQIILKDIATGNRLFDIGGGSELQLSCYNGVDYAYVQQVIFDISGDLNQTFHLPNKPTGVYDLATTDDITGGGYTVVSSNQTAVNDTNYTVVANATFTDPTPSEGKGYVVYVRNGTATIGGTGYAVGSLVFRVFHSGSWSTREYKSNLTIDATPTNGSTNAVQSDGVFDALALKADKLNVETFIFSKANGTFGSHTGTTAETVLLSVDISAGEYAIGDILTFFHQFEKSGTAGSATFRVRAGVNGNTSDSLISTYATMANVSLMQSGERRNLQFITGNLLRGIRNITAAPTDIGAGISVITSTSLNPNNAWKLTFTVQLADATDTASLTGYRIGKLKSF